MLRAKILLLLITCGWFSLSSHLHHLSSSSSTPPHLSLSSSTNRFCPMFPCSLSSFTRLPHTRRLHSFLFPPSLTFLSLFLQSELSLCCWLRLTRPLTQTAPTMMDERAGHEDKRVHLVSCLSSVILLFLLYLPLSTTTCHLNLSSLFLFFLRDTFIISSFIPGISHVPSSVYLPVSPASIHHNASPGSTPSSSSPRVS